MLPIGVKIVTGKKYARTFSYVHKIGKEGIIYDLSSESTNRYGNTYRVNYNLEDNDNPDIWYIQEADCLLIAENNQQAKYLLDKNY